MHDDDDRDIQAAFRPLHIAARRAGVSAAWLRAEAEAGRIPHLRTGRRILFDLDAVVRALRERAESAGIAATSTDGGQHGS